MGKVFYTINLDCSQTYKPLCDLIQYSSANNIHWYQENGFVHYLGKNTILYSCDESDTSRFEKMLRDNNLIFERRDDLLEKYQTYLSPFPNNSQHGTKIPIENQKKVIEKEIPQVIEGLNGCRRLTEETIARKDKIKIYIESNEKCNHNVPHAHVDYNHDFNVFSISLVDFSVLAGDGKGARAKEAMALLRNNIEKAKRIWNSCSNHSKFDTDENNNILDTYHFAKD